MRIDSLILLHVSGEINIEIIDIVIRVCLLEISLHDGFKDVHILLMDVGMLKLVLFDVVLELLGILLIESVLALSKLWILHHSAYRIEDLQVFAGSFHDQSQISFLK